MGSVNWKSVGTNILTLGLAWVFKKVVAKHVPTALANALNDIAGDNPAVPSELRDAIDEVMRVKFQENMDKLLTATAKLLDSAPKAIAKAEELASGVIGGKK